MLGIECMGIGLLIVMSMYWNVLIVLSILVCISVIGCCLGIKVSRKFGNSYIKL